MSCASGGSKRGSYDRRLSRFPDPRYAPGDIVAVGGDLHVETLREAYRKGIFPWPHEGMPLPWFSPRKRTVIFFDELHVSRSLRKEWKRDTFDFTIDANLGAVIRACASSPRPDQVGTWISPQLVQAYTRFPEAHSLEVWQEGSCVGGLYGVDAGGVFTGESMFHLVPNASKIALLKMIEYLREAGCTWIDCQVMTPHMEALGAREIPRTQFLDLLAEAQAAGRELF